MVNLDKDTIDTIKKISDVLVETPYEINNFKVSDTGMDGRTMIDLDIRKKIKQESETD